MRYVGQGLTLPIAVNLEDIVMNGLLEVRKHFEDEHKRLFTYSLDSELELVNIRVVIEQLKHSIPSRKLEKAVATEPSTSSLLTTTNLFFEGQEFEDRYVLLPLLCIHCSERFLHPLCETGKYPTYIMTREG